MSRTVTRTWYVSVERTGEKPAKAVFGHRKGNVGWVWHELPVELPIDPHTEYEVLSEIYSACLDFMELVSRTV